MLTKAWIAILIGLFLGSLLFSSGCGWWSGGYSNNPYYGQPCNCPTPQYSGAPAGVPTASGTPGWRVPAASGSAVGSGGAATSGSATATP